MKKVFSGICVTGILSASVLTSFSLFAQESGCNIFRYNFGKESSIRVVHSCEAIATGEVGIPESPPSEPEPEPEVGPSQEDKDEWVAFINDNCMNFDDVTFDNLEGIQNYQGTWMCQGAVTELPPPAPTYFSDGFMISDMPLTSLSGFSAVTSMPNLSLDNVPVTSLAGMEGITSMMGLEVFGGEEGSPLNDISALSSLQTIDYLSLVYVPNLTDISSLSNLTALKNLDLTETGVSSLSALSNLTSVEFGFYLADNPNLRSLDGLENLTSVGTLFVEYNYNLEDVTGISNLSQADIVGFAESTYNITTKMSADSPFCENARGGGIRRIEGAELPDICEEGGSSQESAWAMFVNVECHNYEDFYYPETTADVENMYLKCNNEFFVELPPAEPTRLNGNFSFSHLRDISGLSLVRESDTELNLSGNEIVDASPLSGLINVNQLIASSNQIENFPNLSSLENFSMLDFSSNNLMNLNGLPSISNPIGGLFFQDNQISNVDGLINTTEVGYLNLTINPIEDFQGLANISSGNIELPPIGGASLLAFDTPFCQGVKNGSVTLINVSESDICLRLCSD